jgi:transposase
MATRAPGNGLATRSTAPKTCEAATPLLITQVETTPAPVADGDVTTVLHQAREQHHRLPQTHLVATG